MPRSSTSKKDGDGADAMPARTPVPAPPPSVKAARYGSSASGRAAARDGRAAPGDDAGAPSARAALTLLNDVPAL